MICQYKLDQLSTLKKQLTKQYRLQQKKYGLNLLFKDQQLIILREFNSKNHNLYMKLELLYKENQYYKKEPDMKLLPDQAEKFITILISNQQYKERMLMFNLIDKQIDMLIQKKQLLLLNTRVLKELKLFKYQVTRSLLNPLSRNMLSKEMFIMFKLHR